MKEMWKISGRLGNQMFQTAYLFAQVQEGKIPDIYLQDEEYFKPHAAIIRRLYSDDIKYSFIDKVSIHVRRGDYVDNPFYVDLFKIGYYERAMRQFPGQKFLVFSDDIRWCEQQEIFEGCEFSWEKDEIKDFNAMASCKGHIIANSSFSWWAAWLSQNKTVAPSQWFTDGIERVGLPANWIRV